MIIEALLLIAALFVIAGIIGVMHKRKKAKQAAEHAELMERLEAANRKERERRKTLRASMPAPYGSAPRVVETRTHQNRYSDRRVADDDGTDVLGAMMIQNAINQASTPVYVSPTREYDNSSISSSTSYGYSSPSSETCSRSSYESSSSSSYDSSSSYSSSDSGSSSSCD